MAPLRFLKRVSRFPARNETHFDHFSYEALTSVSGQEGKELIESIKKTWHRPSGDNAVLEKNLMIYGEPSPRRCNAGDYLAILKKTLDELKPQEKVIPLTLGGSIKHPNMPHSTSPGFPWTTQGYATKRDVFQDPIAVGKIHKAWDCIGRGVPWQLPDSLAFHRVIASERSKSKIRPVWGFPTEVIAEEARFFFPLFSELKELCNERDTCYGIGMETALSGHSHLAKNFAVGRSRFCLNSDLSTFDARVPAWLIRDVFSLMSSWFDFSKVQDSEGKVWNVNPAQTCRRWKSFISYFINTKIRTPTGLRFQKSSGVPSGSMFTNLIDTLCNAVQMRTSLRRISDSLPEKDYYYGDDSCIFLREPVDLDMLAKVLKDVFGAVLSVEKTMLTDNVENIHWLGYYYRKSGPKRDLKFIIASTLFPDREVPTPIEAAARLLGQLFSTMDPLDSVIFRDAVLELCVKFSFTPAQLQVYVQELPIKALKYLQTLGLSMSEITMPDCFVDPFGDRFIPAVIPKPSSRNFFRHRDLNLPRFAFTAEAYQNHHLRTGLYHDFDLYKETFSVHADFDLDSGYFTD